MTQREFGWSSQRPASSLAWRAAPIRGACCRSPDRRTRPEAVQGLPRRIDVSSAFQAFHVAVFYETSVGRLTYLRVPVNHSAS